MNIKHLLFILITFALSQKVVFAQSVKSDSLYAIGVDLYNAGKYKEAIPLFEISDSLDKAELDSTSNRRNYSAMWLASCYHKLNDEKLAKMYYKHYREVPVDRRKTIESDSLSELGIQYYGKKRYHKALTYFSKCADIEEIAAGKDSWFLSNTLYYIGIVYSTLKQNDKAVEYLNRVVAIYRSKGNNGNATFSVLLNQLALCYNALQKNEDAIKTIEEAVFVAKKSYGENSYDYALILSNAGLCHKSAKNYAEAISYYRQTADILQKQTENDITFINARKREAECLSLNGQFYEASSILKEVLPLYKDKFGYKSGEYLYIIEELHTATRKMGKFEEAIKLCDESISLRMELFGNFGIGLAVQYREQAENHVVLKQFKDAITCASKSMEIYKEAKGEKDEYYASALAYLGYCYSYDKQYEKAIEIVKQAIGIREITTGEDTPNFVTSVLNLGTYYKEIYQYKKAIECGRFVVEKRKDIYGDRHVEYAQALSWLATFYNCDGNYNKAIELEKHACDIFYSNNNENYLTSLASLASYYSNCGNYLKAIELGKMSLKICKETLGDSCSHYVTILENLGAFYSNYGNNKEAIRFSELALEISTKLNGENCMENAGILHRMANYYQESGNYKRALLHAQKALSIRKQHKDSNPIEYASNLGLLSIVYNQLGFFNEARCDALAEQRILSDVLGRNHPKYMNSLDNYATILLNVGEFQQAIEAVDKALDICKKVYGEDIISYYEILETKANLFGAMMNNNDAIVLYKRISDYYITHLPPAHPSYMRNQSNYAQALMNQGAFTEARNILINIESLIVNTIGKLHPIYSSYLSSLSSFYMRIGNSSYAKSLIIEQLEVVKELYGENHHNYAECLNQLAWCYYSMNDCQSAIDCSKKAMQITETVFGGNDYRYAISLSNLCAFYSETLETEQSVKYGESALDLIKKTFGEENTYFSSVLINLAWCYAKTGENLKAIDLTKKAMSIHRKILGERNPEYIFLYQMLAGFYASTNDTKNVSKFENVFLDKISKHILNSFTNLISQERDFFWNQYLPYFNLACRASYKFKEKELTEIAYNSILVSKELLLNANIEMEKMLKESKDLPALELYREIKGNQALLDQQYQVPFSLRSINIDSLENVINSQNIELINKSKEFGDFTKKMQLKWKDVRKALSPSEIAIEFEKVSTRDSVIYVAYLIKHNSAFPAMIPLCEEKQILENGNQMSILSKSIWEPMANEIEEAKSIFFAPSGELYNIPIESLPHWEENCLMSDKWNMYRLSSTRELADKKKKKKLEHASIYGGVKYDTGTDMLVADSRKFKTDERSFDIVPFNLADSLKLRDGVAYLPATKSEAVDIDRTLEQKNIATTLRIDTLATEGDFKSLSGKKTDLLHIATHGFYWTEREAMYRNNLDFLMLGDKHPRYIEDKALTRSGLLLAGANNALMGKKLPEGVDDGILTAKEISQLDLCGLDLVVLSACQTGLGEIKGDGVFGLQRGFKKAGANSIMMSLWKVDDEATRLLMTQFYKNLTSGKSKFESLKLAQKFVREYEVEVEVKDDERHAVSAHAKVQEQKDKAKTYKKVRKYQDPYYWAAFILLDAID